MQPLTSIQNLKKSSLEEIVTIYGKMLQAEFAYRRECGLDWTGLKRYYRNLFDEQERLKPLGLKGYFLRLAPALAICLNSAAPLRIVDAGAGYGTESFLFAMLGHQVTGVELVKDRVEMALSRIPYFNSCLGQELNISFVNSNILSFLEKMEPVDLIWTMEAISHISPLEPFFERVHQKLVPGGFFIISDPNKLNPLSWAKSIKIRGSFRHKPHTRFHDPETKKPIEYNQELIYTIRDLTHLTGKVGFSVVNTHMSGFLGSSFIPERWSTHQGLYSVLVNCQKILKNLPILRRFGSIYTLVLTN